MLSIGGYGPFDLQLQLQLLLIPFLNPKHAILAIELRLIKLTITDLIYNVSMKFPYICADMCIDI